MLFKIVTGRHPFKTKEDIIAGDLIFDSSLSRGERIALPITVTVALISISVLTKCKFSGVKC